MSSAASRIIKAKQYAQERDQRFTVQSFEIEIQGDNADHLVTYNHGVWNCDCEEFRMQGVCAHVMATERMLGDSVELARIAMPAAA